MEAAFAATPGVTATAVGYEGGALDRPTYKDVCTDETGHAEVVEVEFDSERLSYDTLLDLFFEMHDPTTLNRQGPDWGNAISVGDFLSLAGAADTSNSKDREAHERGPLQAQAHRNQGRAGADILARRGIPPALSGEARTGVVPHLKNGDKGTEGASLRVSNLRGVKLYSFFAVPDSAVPIPCALTFDFSVACSLGPLFPASDLVAASLIQRQMIHHTKTSTNTALLEL